MAVLTRSPRLTACILSASAGFVDTLGFVALFGLFTAHVTGNFVLIAKAMIQLDTGIVAKLLALPTFMIAVALSRLWVRAHTKRGWTGPAPLLIVEVLLLIGFLAVGVLATPLPAHETEATIVTGLLAVTAMGVQNAAARLVFSDLPPTTVMTGNVTQIVIDVVDLLAGQEPDAAAMSRKRLKSMWPTVAAFTLGAAGGGFGFATLGFTAVVLPIILLLIVVAAHWRA